MTFPIIICWENVKIRGVEPESRATRGHICFSRMPLYKVHVDVTFAVPK